MDNPLKLPRTLFDSALTRLDDTVRSAQTAEYVADWEDRITQRRLETRSHSGDWRGAKVIVHRGWVAQGKVRVHARVIEAPSLPEAASRIPYWDVMTSNIRRHAVLAFPGVELTMTVAGVAQTRTTDRHGFAAFTMDVGELMAGWHDAVGSANSELIGDEPVTGKGRVFRPADDAAICVISDIDDTVLRTGLDEGLTAFRRTIMGDAHTRRAVPGMASLYRGLYRGLADEDGSPPPKPGFFYLSTGSWSFYEMLTQFLQLRGFPRGPLFLTDWGPTDRYIHRSGKEHKEQALDRIESGYPDTPMVLIGDSGQRDATIYTEFARAHPGRVRLILILHAGDGSTENTELWRDKMPELAAEGIPLYVVQDAREAVDVCRRERLVDAITAEEVEIELGAVF